MIGSYAKNQFPPTIGHDPHAALAAVGVEAPAGTTVKVMEDTAETQHLVLPVSPAAAGELSSEELEKVAGGANSLDCGANPVTGVCGSAASMEGGCRRRR